MLNLKNVSKFYYNKGIIATGFTKVNLELKLGEFVVITGESGSGKSTLLNVISGLDSYEEGEMYINGEETSHYTEKEFEDYRRKYIANIFQSFNLINSYTVYQNVELVLLLNGYKKRQVKKKVLDMIEKVGLTKFKNTKVSKLSGGQKQRVAIARAMVKDTPIIVADEPTGNLDTESAKDVIEILKKVAKDKLVIVVTHNIEQVEEYATRIIKMHDGRIIENTQRKEIKDEKRLVESEYHKITIFNKWRLGIRNTFNIVTKFLLLFAVFLFITIALLAEYAGFALSEDENNTSYGSAGFSDLSENRIIIKKQDKTPFTQEDYEKIKALSNTDYIVEDDLFIDNSISFYRNDISFYGNMRNIENLKGTVDLGRMPQAENEIVVRANKDQYNISHNTEEVLNKTYTLRNDGEQNKEIKVIIVGIQYRENDYDYQFEFYLSTPMMEQLRSMVNRNYSDITVFFNNKYTSYTVLPSEKVEKGKAIVSDDLKYEFSDGRVRNKPIIVTVSNIYYKEELNLTVGNTYTKSNYTRVTGYENYSPYQLPIFINQEEYDAIFDKPSYQSSVYIKDAKEIDQTMQELETLGMKPKKAMDFRVDYNASYKQVMKIIKLVVTVVLIVVLFFISYFIIRIILKSRNIYYTTLRMLGATFKSVKRILDIELFVNSTLAYMAVLGFIYLINQNMISFEYIAKLTSYLTIREYVVMYLVLTIMSQLIARRFSKKLFKNTAINTYNEEV